MPELAEVEYYRKIWDPGLGQKVLRVHVREKSRIFRGEPHAAFTGLEGTTYKGSKTHGKNLLFEFSKQLWVGGHLGMTGKLICGPPDHEPEKADHLVLYQKKQSLIFRDFRMFGRLRIHEGKLPPPWWQELPAEVMGDDFTAARVQEALTRHGKMPLKMLLLNQSWFPGIGNWMADEILWQLKWKPARLAGVVTKPEAAKLRKITRHVSEVALKTIGETWEDPPNSWLMNHRWKNGGNCPRCKGPLKREDLRGRTCCWCPKCQAV